MRVTPTGVRSQKCCNHVAPGADTLDFWTIYCFCFIFHMFKSSDNRVFFLWTYICSRCLTIKPIMLPFTFLHRTFSPQEKQTFIKRTKKKMKCRRVERNRKQWRYCIQWRTPENKSCKVVDIGYNSPVRVRLIKPTRVLWAINRYICSLYQRNYVRLF